jgi:hypothetical protein
MTGLSGKRVSGIEIFKVGRHTAMNGRTIDFTQAHLDAIAACYDKAASEAPFVVGHPKTDAPAYGWVDGLSVVGDRLVADPAQLNPDFAELVKGGSFKKISASFYPPDSAANPKPGSWYLRHVGFLGAQPPAVKGLKDASFADDAEVLEFADWDGLAVVTLFRGLREFLIAQFGLDKANEVLPGDAIDQLQMSAAQPDPCPTDPTDLTPAFGENMATAEELTAREAELLDRETKLQADRQKLLRGSYTDFADSLIREGRFPGAERDNLVAFMETIGEEPVDFAEGTGTVQKAPIDWFKGFLRIQPGKVPQGGLTGGEDTDFAETDDHQVAIQQEMASAKAGGRSITAAEAVTKLRIKGVIK